MSTTEDRENKARRRVADVLKHASDPTRLDIIKVLAAGEQYVGALCGAFNMQQAAVSHHLRILSLGGIVERDRRGQQSFYRLSELGVVLVAAVGVLDAAMAA